jgi:hypothetical protein
LAWISWTAWDCGAFIPVMLARRSLIFTNTTAEATSPPTPSHSAACSAHREARLRSRFRYQPLSPVSVGGWK